MITSKIQGGQEPGVGWSEVPEDGGQREPAGGGRHQPVPRTQGQGEPADRVSEPSFFWGGSGFRGHILKIFRTFNKMSEITHLLV